MAKTAQALADDSIAGTEALTTTKEPVTEAKQPAKAQEPDLVTVLIAGKTYQVSPDVAESISQEQATFHRERGRLAAETERAKPKAEKVESTTAVPKRPPASLALEDYAEFDRQMQAYEAYRDLQLEQRMEERYRKDVESRESASRQKVEVDTFMSRLTKAHPSLEGETDLVYAAMGRIAKKYPSDPLPFSDPRTMELVVEESTRELARLAEKGKSIRPVIPRIEKQGRVDNFGGETRESKPKRPVSIADIQREERKARQRAARARLMPEED